MCTCLSWHTVLCLRWFWFFFFNFELGNVFMLSPTRWQFFSLKNAMPKLSRENLFAKNYLQRKCFLNSVTPTIAPYTIINLEPDVNFVLNTRQLQNPATRNMKFQTCTQFPCNPIQACNGSTCAVLPIRIAELQLIHSVFSNEIWMIFIKHNTFLIP